MTVLFQLSQGDLDLSEDEEDDDDSDEFEEFPPDKELASFEVRFFYVNNVAVLFEISNDFGQYAILQSF